MVCSTVPRSSAICLFSWPVIDVLQHLAFARRERGQPLPDVVEFGAGLPLMAVRLDGGADGLEEILVVDRLGEEINRAALHGAHAHRDVAVAGEEDDRDLAAPGDQRLLQLQAVQARHRHVQHQAAGCVRIVLIEELLRRGERDRIQPGRPQQPRKAFSTDGSSSTMKTVGLVPGSSGCSFLPPAA